MLKIDEGFPWVMWPNNLVDNFVIDPANRIFDYDGNYQFYITFSFDNDITKKSTLFSKLPSYLGIDLDENGFTFIYTYQDGTTEYETVSNKWETKRIYSFCVSKKDEILSIHLDGLLLFSIKLKQKLALNDNSHIIFGAGNFPKNNFNLNYFSVILYRVTIMKEGNEIAHHNFDKFIHNKSFDNTNNCNFIYKI